jgi:hypothetical protein
LELRACGARSTLALTHGKNRICSNDKLSANTGGAYDVDAAAVKELYAGDGTSIAGYAVYRKTSEGGSGGDFYWYERISRVAADGLGSSGPAKDVCVACHAGAGSDSGHDFVYTQVK